MLARLMCSISIIVLSAFDARPALAGPPPSLLATKPWSLRYDYAECLALRDYGTPDHPVSLIIRPGPNAETFEFLIGRRQFGPQFVKEVRGTVDFGRGPIDAWVLMYAGKGKTYIQQFRISAIDMDQARSATTVTFSVKGGQDVSLGLNNMSELTKGMRDCAADLKLYWNEGGEKDGRIAVPAKGDVRAVFTDNDYPEEAYQRQQQGSAQFLLLVDEQGTVAGCQVLKPSGIPIFDALGCAVIRERAKFQPALDAKGKPVRSTYVTPPVTWRLG